MDLNWLAPALAAVSTVVVALIGATLADRFTLRRLERVDKLLADSTSDGKHRELLEQVRDRLVERVAARELRPRNRQGVAFGLLFLIVGLAMAAAVILRDALSLEISAGWASIYTFFGSMFVTVGALLLVTVVADRRVWEMTTLPSEVAARELRRESDEALRQHRRERRQRRRQRPSDSAEGDGS